MYIQIKTGSVPVSVWLDVWAAEASYSGVSSEPYAEAWPSAEYIPFPTFADEIPGPIPDPDAYSFSSFQENTKSSCKVAPNTIIQIFQQLIR